MSRTLSVSIVLFLFGCGLPHSVTPLDAQEEDRRPAFALPVDHDGDAAPAVIVDAVSEPDAGQDTAPDVPIFVIEPYDAGNQPDVTPPPDVQGSDATPNPPDAGPEASSPCTTSTCNPAGGGVCMVVSGEAWCCGAGVHATRCPRGQDDCGSSGVFFCQNTVEEGPDCCVEPSLTWPR